MLEKRNSIHAVDRQQYNLLKLENDIIKEHMEKLYSSVSGLMDFKEEQNKEETQKSFENQSL